MQKVNKIVESTQAPTGAVKQHKRNETGFPYQTTRPDSTLDKIYDGAFGHSAKKCVIEKIAGNHYAEGYKNSHTNNKGWDTLSSDSRNDPIAGTDVALEFPNANNNADIRITESSDLGSRKKRNPKGNVLRG